MPLENPSRNKTRLPERAIIGLLCLSFDGHTVALLMRNYVKVVFAVLICLPMTTMGNDITNAFFLPVIPQLSEGYIVLSQKSELSNVASNTIADNQILFSWSGSNFLRESSMNGSPGDYHILNTNSTASGTWAGTNWEYRDGNLILDLEPGPQMIELQASLGGRTPERDEFEKFLGRGLDLSDLTNIIVHDGSFDGKIDQKVPFHGHILYDSTSEVIKCQYDIESSKGRIGYIREVKLVPFKNDEYLTSQLISFLIRHGTTNKLSEYKLIDFGTNSLVNSLCPFTAYKGAKTFVLVNDAIYSVQGNSRLKLSSTKATITAPMPHARLVFLIVFIVISALFTIPIIRMSFRKTIHKTQKNNENNPS